MKDDLMWKFVIPIYEEQNGTCTAAELDTGPDNHLKAIFFNDDGTAKLVPRRNSENPSNILMYLEGQG